MQQTELNFEFENVIGSDWNISHLNTVVYIQDVNTKEVYQTSSTFK